MSPYFLLGGVGVWVASLAGTAVIAYDAGQDSEVATQAREEQARQETRAIMVAEAASAISSIKVNHTTIRQKATTEIRRDPIYVECNHPDAVRRLLDNALANGLPTVPAAGSELSASNTAR
jgi:hypothetical protein